MSRILTISTGLAVALAGMGAAVLCLGAPPMAGTNVKAEKAACGPLGPCPVNNHFFGYYEPRWREWPCPRPDKTFPASIGRERLPTPSGTPTVPPPRATPPEEPRADEPWQPEGPGGEGILPPGGFQLDEGSFRLPGAMEEPAEPRSPLPPGVPGLPSGVPGLPRNTEPRMPPPTLPPSGLPGMPPSGLPAPILPPPGPSGILPEVPLDPQAMLPPPAFEPRPAEAFPQEMPVEPLESAYEPPPAVAANRPSALEDTPPLETPLEAPLETPLQSPQPSPVALHPTVQPAALAPTTPLASDVPPGENGSLWRLKRALANARNAATHEAPPSEGWAEASQQGVAWNEPYAPPAVPTPMAPETEAPPMNLPAIEAAPAIAVRAVDHQSPVELQFRTAQPQVYQQPIEQPVQQPDVTVQGVWQAEAAPMLEGYCPVSLVKNEQWVKGEPRWSVVHEGRTYYLADEIQRECFLVNPERYVPALGGFDPVTFVDEGRNVPGVLDYCVTYDGRLYMFSSSTALARFRQDSRRYLSNLH